MTLTPSALRLDLKCGKGAISKGEKCHKGPATAAKENNTLRNVALGVGAAAVIGGSIYGARKYKSAQTISKKPLARNATPEQQISRGRAAFKEARGLATGVQVAGAGLGLAGAGLVANELKKDPKKRNVAAISAGAAMAYLGAGTVMTGSRIRQQFNTNESTFNVQAEDYKRQYYQARERAQQNAASGKEQRVGSNQAVTDPFKDLGVSSSVSDAELKKTWLKLMRQHHPDAGGDPRKAQQINAAYQEILRRRGKLDSAYADGFTIDWDAIAL